MAWQRNHIARISRLLIRIHRVKTLETDLVTKMTTADSLLRPNFSSSSLCILSASLVYCSHHLSSSLCCKSSTSLSQSQSQSLLSLSHYLYLSFGKTSLFHPSLYNNQPTNHLSQGIITKIFNYKYLEIHLQK